jgi:decaprenylphospho-beta-D-ribofuranose 2-oxidase
VSIDALITRLLPIGWFIPVTPGTRSVTVGGAIAADVHGKNHHVEGSFGSHVVSLDLLAADGSVRTLDPVGTPQEFWATVGGMGLTGVVLRARVVMKPVPSAYISVETQRGTELDDLMARQVELEERYPYSVAWIDCLSKGARLGRGVITAGRFAEVDELMPAQVIAPLGYSPSQPVSAPRISPSGMLNRWSVSAFNEAWYRKAPASRSGEIQSMSTFFHPLDGVTGWNRLYGRQGFVQYQFVVPESGSDVVRLAVERLSAIGAASFLAVLKRFGPGDAAPLSFPMAGWTLALDIPTGVVGLGEVLDDLDEAVAQAGGRVYLAKDARLRAALVPYMYPRLDEWRGVRDRMDPHHVFRSDQARRLHL